MRTGRLLPCLFGIAACVPIGETRRDERPSGNDSAESAAVPGDIAISPHNLIANATFEDGTSLPWTSSFSAPANGEVGVVDGALCLRIDNRGYNNWDAQIRHREMVIQRGHRYSISFRAFASQPTHVRPKVGMQGPPYAEYWFDEIQLDPTPRRFTGKFRKSGEDDPGAEFAFHMGGRLADGTHSPLTVCIDDVRLEDQQFTRSSKQKSESTVNILVNQVGYYPNLAKIATLRSDAKQQLDWKLMAADGHEAAYGKTQPAGLDTPSGERVHIIDFSAFKGTGRGFVLTVGPDRSRPFEIGNDLYRKMKYDALAYYYHNRSGIDIAMPYAGGAQWTRPAGHLSDKSVPCVQGSGCAYRLDVTGGWYDAGDHGKYVVNGGISVWTLLNLYERAQFIGKSTKALADGTLNIPEQHNGVADLLDEVRWELEFLLKMQVPDGQPKAGMVHHKVHDKEWTALGLAPHEDPMPRFLYPVSTAATLNLAAVAAQAGRIWKTIDPAFAARCVTAAEKAWAAAAHNPAVFAKPGGVGGGPYEDNHVEDEFYWAAAELFITTKRPEYRQYFTSSPSFLKVPVHLGQGEGEGIPFEHDVAGSGCARHHFALDRAGRLAGWRAEDRAQRRHRRRGCLHGDSQTARFSRSHRLGQEQQVALGLELVSAQQSSRARSGGGLHRRAQVPERRGCGNGLHPRPQCHGSILRDGLGLATAGESAPSLLGLSIQQQVSPRAARRSFGRPQLGIARSLRQGRQHVRLRARQVLRRQHRILGDQRDHHQLECTAGLGLVLPRRAWPGGPRKQVAVA